MAIGSPPLPRGTCTHAMHPHESCTQQLAGASAIAPSLTHKHARDKAGITGLAGRGRACACATAGLVCERVCMGTAMAEGIGMSIGIGHAWRWRLNLARVIGRATSSTRIQIPTAAGRPFRIMPIKIVRQMCAADGREDGPSLLLQLHRTN